MLIYKLCFFCFFFKGRLDLKRVVMVGYLFGGVIIVLFLVKDKWFRYCVYYKVNKINFVVLDIFVLCSLKRLYYV